MGEGAPKTVIIRKVKKGGHGGAHGGAWKVAYADFVTAMMALFMVLWLLTQADMKLRKQIASYFKDVGVLPGSAMIHEDANEVKSREPKVVSKDIIVVQGKGAEQELPEGNAAEIKQAIEKAAKESPQIAQIKDQVMVNVTPEGLWITVIDKGHDLLFDVSSDELKPALVELIKRIALILGQLENKIQIGGHTDARPFPPNSQKSNWELSFARANNARRILDMNGLWWGQLDSVIGYADTKLAVPEDPLAAQNRRLTILAVRQQPLPPKTETIEDGFNLPPVVVEPEHPTALDP